MAGHVHTPEEIAAEHRRYMQVFVWLGVLTLAELGVTYMGLPKFLLVLILIVLALTKAAMVGLFYMHLAVERRTLMLIAITPLFLCAFLVFMLAPDHTHTTRMQVHKTAPAEAAPAHH